MSAFSLEILSTDGRARRGRLQTAHGPAETPAFMPVGTAATVKAMTVEAVASTGAEIVLGNTYHLMLRPTAERVARLGGLHRFMGWKGPILTDSGGFQVMSLSKFTTQSEDGVTFASHIDGSRHLLSPERSMEIQNLLDATITMAFDECPPLPLEERRLAESMRRSMRWAERSRAAFVPRPGYALFGINQGGISPELREESARALVSIGFEGYAIGGLAVGEPQEDMLRTLDVTVPFLPADKPRYLMGVGRPEDLVESVRRGVDMFDCVLPTRSGRTGKAFTRRGEINMRNARHRDDPRPIEEGCSCPACRSFSRAYIHHLIRAQEILGAMLLTWHNIQHYQDLMADLRRAIENQSLETFVRDFHATLNLGDIEPLEGGFPP
ncbi:tRNA guanosine(34) transglycosylase Tgt [Phaeovibrio sulfidiphilus]|uniref:Queuine tRNA-ribosyltransferase n=1 Tax=Phaeovibrio sulfidiphilus TaxID=1220600 RepID=A0A8J6YUZ5_9PROT|nr:tRNA guanosine(34) transglycosylase Tgt [Phaeovibrio sulfidiphilus]